MIKNDDEKRFAYERVKRLEIEIRELQSEINLKEESLARILDEINRYEAFGE